MTQHLGDDAELYPLGILDEHAALEVERHIATCVPCAARVMRAQLTAAQLAAGLPAATPSPSLERRIADSSRAPGIAESVQAEQVSVANERLDPAPRSTVARAATGTNGSSFVGRAGSLALAAGLALAVIALGWQTLAFRARVASDDLALATIVHSHFNHIAMTPESQHPVAAKVLYARDGSWLYIIADEPNGALHVKVRTRSGLSDLGALRSSGRMATLLARPPERIEAVTLQRDGADVASATLIYGK
jgi:anti-sigma factor RsiW